MRNDSCVFCRIIRREIHSKIVFEDEEILAFEDLKPQAPVHILIVPKRHIEKAFDLAIDDAGLISKLILRANAVADQYDLCASGYRIVLNCGKDAGQEVFHLHLHLLGGRKFTWPPG